VAALVEPSHRRWLWKGRKPSGDDDYDPRRSRQRWRNFAAPISPGETAPIVRCHTPATTPPPASAPVEITPAPDVPATAFVAAIAPEITLIPHAKIVIAENAENAESLPTSETHSTGNAADSETVKSVLPAVAAGNDAVNSAFIIPRSAPSKPTKVKKKRVPTGRRMLINVIDSEQARVAIVGTDGLEELYIERAGGRFVHGNIFKGRVVNIQPNLQAAFVDIGSEKHAFLHAYEVIPPFGGYEDILTRRRKKAPSDPQFMKINDMLTEGQELLVQVTREELLTKGPSVTTFLSIPGRYLVLMPASHTRGVSKKITSENQRRELRRELAKLSPPKDMGFIIRTAGLGRGSEELQLDLDALTEMWREISDAAKKAEAPALLHHENELTIRAVRDYCNDTIDELIIDRREEYAKAVAFIKRMMPDFYARTRLYDRREPLFTAYKVEDDIAKLFDESVKLPSGGEILIQQTEAMVSIDVNTGKMLKAESTRDMIRKTNLEAAVVIAHQLRLRDMGGLVMIDFIDMERVADRRELEEAMRTATSGDRARMTMLPLSQFGIMEMTRQRLRQSLHLAHYQPCPYCGGSGKCRRPESLEAEFIRRLRAELAKGNDLRVTFHPRAALSIANDLRQKLLELENEFGRRVSIVADKKLLLDQYIFTAE
jgi:ribonuclease E